MVVDHDLDSGIASEAVAPSPSQAEALIKEAKRHQRVRYGFTALAIIAVALIVLLAVIFSGGTSRPASKAPQHPEVGVPTAGSTTCRSDQLVIDYKGSQGATGQISSGFWIANTSPDSCTLRSSVTVDLLDGSTLPRLSASTTIASPIDLPGNNQMPSGNVVPKGDHLAWVNIVWPGTALAQESIGAPTSHCTQPSFTPTAIRFGFKGISPITVSQLSASPLSTQPLTLCGTGHFYVGGVNSLSN
jgi:hypothetical protein